ncbi:MAG: hypothetical protein HYS13_26055 [Planctomycetia bacterium]|nr:hypothetical protein [Planctomycetia bacterium]
MSYKSPTLPGIALGIAVAILVAHWRQGDVALETSESRPSAATRQTASSAAGILGESPAYAAMRPENDGGAELLARAIDKLKSQHSIAAKARQVANLYGQQLNGTGSYTQMAGPEGVSLSRFELKLQTAEGPANWQQVCDGAALWTYRKNLDGPRLTSVDINTVLSAYRQRLAGASADPAAPLSPPIGGLPELLDSLARHMTFKEVFSEQLGDVDVWVAKGRWNPSTLSDLIPDQRDRIRGGKSPDWSKAPRHVPDHVLIYLGKTDLFPYRIEHRRDDAPPDRPLAMLELFEVRLNRPIDPRVFDYKPGRRAADATAEYLREHGLPAPKAKEEGEA